MKDIKLAFSLKWYELLLVMIELGLLAAGIWACIDSLSIGCPMAAWRFLLLFVIWALPGAVILFFFKPAAE
ncbi:MAG TPA: hypothetical protein PKG60_01545 [Spirochaetota bacterium]|nr:hypothetical protein [Spirochaetota bacterium]HPS85844.1 hypothetical protein [Spirochaetota bacterium]